MQQLGKALSILAQQEAAESFFHADVNAWGAPSECHALVSKGEADRVRQARRHAEAVAKMPLRVILKKAFKRGGLKQCHYNRHWNRLFQETYESRYPF